MTGLFAGTGEANITAGRPDCDLKGGDGVLEKQVSCQNPGWSLPATFCWLSQKHICYAVHS